MLAWSYTDLLHAAVHPQRLFLKETGSVNHVRKATGAIYS